MSYVNTTSVMGTGAAFAGISIAAVSLRFYTRLRQKRARLGADDWFSLAAMVLVVAACGICIAGAATNTIGVHSPDIGRAIFTYESAQQQLNKKLEFAFYAAMVPALVFLKLSVLFLYRRIFQINRTFLTCFWILTITTICWGVGFFVAWLARCGDHPENAIISLATLTTKCVNSFDILITQASLDVAVDIGILVLPIPFVLQLKISTQRKMAVLAILLIGSLSIGCGIARMVIVAWILGTPLFQDAYIAGESSTDFLGIVSEMIFWGLLEIGVGMVAICLPTLRPVIDGASDVLLHSFHSLRSLSLTPSNLSFRSREKGGDDNSVSSEDKTIRKDVEYSVTSWARDRDSAERFDSVAQFA